MRSAGSAPRHLVFRAGELDVGLRLVPEGEAYTVSGQLLGTGATPCEHRAGHAGMACAGRRRAPGRATRPRARCSRATSSAASTSKASSLGVELRLRLGEEAIALPPIDVGERPG
ncbi:MAG: hypothetical protein U1F67_24155 [Rubrivivax sp.]